MSQLKKLILTAFILIISNPYEGLDYDNINVYIIPKIENCVIVYDSLYSDETRQCEESEQEQDIIIPDIDLSGDDNALFL